MEHFALLHVLHSPHSSIYIRKPLPAHTQLYSILFTLLALFIGLDVRPLMMFLLQMGFLYNLIQLSLIVIHLIAI